MNEDQSAPIRFLGDMQRLVVHPGDLFVIRYEHHLRPQQRDDLREALKAHMPEGVKVLVLDGGAKVGVIAGTELTPKP